MSEKEKVEGYVEHIIFRNEENGYTVLNLSMKGRELTCVGTLPMIGEGELIEASGLKMKYMVGTMIETPRAAVTSDEIAEEAEFFSFGTNDLTQMTFGFSRDDVGRILET